MADLILYFIELFNIKTATEFVIADMEEELSTVHDLVELKKFAKQNINNIDFKFMNGLQTFLVVIKKYKALEFKVINTDRLVGAKKQAHLLSNKFRTIHRLIETNKKAQSGNWENFKDNGKCRFLGFERKALNQIGTPIQVMRLQLSYSGKDPLEEKLTKIFSDLVESDYNDKIRNIAKNRLSEKIKDEGGEKTVSMLLSNIASNKTV
jgi:hypothetical protein